MMTDNVQKMYELAKIPVSEWYLCCPSFTDTKQLELIKWLASEQNDVEISWYSDIGFRVNNFLDSCEHKDFSQALAGLVCELWDDLIPKQKEEIKRILE